MGCLPHTSPLNEWCQRRGLNPHQRLLPPGLTSLDAWDGAARSQCNAQKMFDQGR